VNRNNLTPGVVIDRGVTNSSIFEFYLFSHSGIQGTSCPTHYRMLLNDVEDLDSNEKVQDLTYYLSFEYAKTLSPVSMVTPCYYALNNANKLAKYSREFIIYLFIICLFLCSEDCVDAAQQQYLVNSIMRGRNTFN